MTFDREVPSMNPTGRQQLVIGAIAAATVGALVLWSVTVDRVKPPGRHPAPECVRDEDCVLQPSRITCCGTCPAARPYEAISAVHLVQLLRDADLGCARTLQHCDPPACPGVETDSEVHAACTAGVCRVVELPPATWIARERSTSKE